ncbi:MAG: sodium/solute symporter [Synergistetes bacterium]|nr:sodium/solute symporter [Synergistota bacterium]MCX8128423.1 sodium/solute symporter [Synergistota bacterium]MDW8192575.1 sodium/solute symporter [Synergistota bacterium]
MQAPQVTPVPGTFLVVVLLYLAFVLYLGWVSSKKALNLNEFFVMGGSAGILLGGLGYFATQYSISTFLGVPGTIYNVGWAGLAVSVPTAAFSMLVPAALVGGPLLRLGKKLGLLTLPDYLADRYESKAIRVISAIAIIVFLIPYMGAQTIGAGTIFNTFTGWPYWVGVCVMGLGVTVYCFMGGIRGAMYTNIVQGILMVFTAILTFWGAANLAGGVEAANKALLATDPKAFTMPGSPTKYMLYPFFLSNVMLWNLFAVGQPQLATKFFLMRDRRVLWGAAIASGIGMFLSVIFMYSAAVLARAAIPGIPPKMTDWVVPTLVSKALHPIIGSILMAGVLSAGMSTIDSVVVAVSGAFARDLYQQVINPKASEQTVLKVARVATLLAGIAATLIGIYRPATIFQIILFVFGGLGINTILLVLGTRWKRANKYGALSGLIIGLISVIYFTKTPALTKGFHALIPSAIITLIVMIIVSLITPPPSKEVIKKHFE